MEGNTPLLPAKRSGARNGTRLLNTEVGLAVGRTSNDSSGRRTTEKKYLNNAGLFATTHPSEDYHDIEVDPPGNNEKTLSFPGRYLDDTQRSITADTARRLAVYGDTKGRSCLEHEWWYRKSHSFLALANGKFYWFYLIWIYCVWFFGAVAMWLVSSPGDLQGKYEGNSFWDALYMSAACVSQSGLATVNWSAQSTPVHLVSYCCILLGSMCLMTIIPAILRRHSFRLQVEVEHEMEQEQIQAGSNTRGSGDFDSASSSGSRAQAWELEYRALGLVIKLVLGYWLFIHVSAFLIMQSYITFSSRADEIAKNCLQPEKLKLNPILHTIYLTTSSFQNNGLVLTESSVECYAKDPLILFMVSFLIICGNTGLPIMMRLTTWLVWKVWPAKTPTKSALAFLLEHPRRCYTHMFPGVHTLWLVVCLFVLDGLPIVVMLTKDAHSSAFLDPETGQEMTLWFKFWNAFCNAVSARTAGVNSVDLFKLGILSTYTITVMMYISTAPTFVTMRYSAVHRGHKTELDITGHSEGWEQATAGPVGDNTIVSQFKAYLAQDLAYLFFIVFGILYFESDKFQATAAIKSPEDDGIYNDYDFLKVIFEMCSAYGTVGLSLGYRNAAWSFSGDWTRPSQMLLVWAMLLGRMRGQPESIDPSVATTMHCHNDYHLPIEGEEMPKDSAGATYVAEDLSKLVAEKTAENDQPKGVRTV